MRWWIAIAMLALAGCASQSAEKCTAENIMPNIEKMSAEMDAELATHEASLDQTEGDEKLAHLLAGTNISRAKLVLLLAKFQAKDGDFDEACDTLHRIRTDPALGMMFSPL